MSEQKGSDQGSESSESGSGGGGGWGYGGRFDNPGDNCCQRCDGTGVDTSGSDDRGCAVCRGSGSSSGGREPAPCASFSLVLMADGTLKRAGEIVKGDVVATGGSRGTSPVVCVLRTRMSLGVADLVQLGDHLRITHGHPVRINGKWHLPSDLAPVQQGVPCDSLNLFLLSHDHTMLIGGFECVALAHEFKDAVVQHAYFGTQAVVEDMKRMRGWDSGVVELSSNGRVILRDEVTGSVCQ